jgi:hypothetical protein
MYTGNNVSSDKLNNSLLAFVSHSLQVMFAYFLSEISVEDSIDLGLILKGPSVE